MCTNDPTQPVPAWCFNKLNWFKINCQRCKESLRTFQISSHTHTNNNINNNNHKKHSNNKAENNMKTYMRTCAQFDQNLHWACLDNQWCKVSSCGQRRLWSDCADGQADLSHRWAHMSEGTFSHVTSHIVLLQHRNYVWNPCLPCDVDRRRSQIVVDGILFYYYYFSEKIRLNISSSAR